MSGVDFIERRNRGPKVAALVTACLGFLIFAAAGRSTALPPRP
jgi:hypothetical protein